MSFSKFSKSEFERIFYALEPDFELNGSFMNKVNSHEYVYTALIGNGFQIVLYSSVSTHTNKARAKGNDTIRVNLYHNTSSKPVRKATRTFRTDNWMVNLQSKIEELISVAIASEPCTDCDGELIRKKGEYGEFIGCTNFPKCNAKK
jgi:hypothetical protein